MKNLIFLRSLKTIYYIFIDVFLSLYILQATNNNLVKLVSYHIVVILMIICIFLISRKFCDTYGSKLLAYRAGIITSFIFFVLLAVFKNQLAEYLYLIAIVHGLFEGLYYSSYNAIEAEIINKTNSASFYGAVLSSESIVKIIFPVLFGVAVKYFDSISFIILFLIIFLFEMLLSYKLPIDLSKNIKSEIKLRKILKNKKFINLAKLFFLMHLVDRSLRLYIIFAVIIFLKESVDIGIFESIFGLLTLLTGLAFYKVNRDYNKKVNWLAFTIIFSSIITLFVVKSWWSVIFYKFCIITVWRIVYVFTQSVSVKISDYLKTEGTNKDDFYTAREMAINPGRILGFVLLYFIISVNNVYVNYLALGVLLVAVVLIFVYMKKIEQELALIRKKVYN